MDGTRLQQIVMGAYGKAAQQIGTPYQQYRPISATDPISVIALLGSMQVSMNADDPTYARPNVYGKATWYAVADGTQLAVGDYLVGVEGTFFIAAIQQLLPIFVVNCNRIASVTRAEENSGAGMQPYNADEVSTEIALMTQWPCSILQGTKGEKGNSDLPGDVRSPWVAILLPYWSAVTLRTSDIVTDDLGRRYIISSAELTDLGWRLTALQAQT